MDQFLYPILKARLRSVASPLDVDIVHQGSFSPPIRNDGCSVKNRVATLRCTAKRFEVQYIANAMFYRELSERIQVGSGPAQDTYRASFLNKCSGKVRTEETCAAGNQYSHRRSEMPPVMPGPTDKTAA